MVFSNKKQYKRIELTNLIGVICIRISCWKEFINIYLLSKLDNSSFILLFAEKSNHAPFNLFNCIYDLISQEEIYRISEHRFAKPFYYLKIWHPSQYILDAIFLVEGREPMEEVEVDLLGLELVEEEDPTSVN